MANRNEVMNKINEYKNIGQDIVRREYIKELSEETKHDTIIYFSSFPCKYPVDPELLSINLNDIQGFMTCINGLSSDKLDLIIHSLGGSLEATEQIVQYLRSKYKYIRAIIPQNAMSAASMLACACDEIVMGRESAIGPIDPQMLVRTPNGNMFLPAYSILADFKKAKAEIAENPSLIPIWVSKLSTIPHGYLDFCQKTIEVSKQKVAEWLDSYMFKDNPGLGHVISDWLGDFEEHKTHGRPINYELAKEKGLKVSRLEDNPALQDKVLSIYHAALVTFDVSPCVKIIENQKGAGSYLQVQIMPQGK